MPLTQQQVAGGIILGAGALAAYSVWKDAPELSEEDAENTKKVALGIGGFVVIVYVACKKFNWGFCKDLGVG